MLIYCSLVSELVSASCILVQTYFKPCDVPMGECCWDASWALINAGWVAGEPVSDVERPKTPNHLRYMDGVLADGGVRGMNGLQTDDTSWTMLIERGPPPVAYFSPQ